ncbi:MAG: citramalate synthase, partial [Clostridia bacterium]|nr:citramalate synthase [Clostridia bacterium]
MKLVMYDVTLREGSQGGGISLSVNDKIKTVQMLDKLGVAFIEAGNPFSNPKDRDFFEKIKEKRLNNSKLVAFGATAKKGANPEKDEGLQALLSADTEYVAIFGKAWDFHVKEILKVSLEENLQLIKESIEYLNKKGKRVFFDAEHFFDGFKANKDYALKVAQTAAKAGAYAVVLCDTNGGCFPFEIEEITKQVKADVPIGIHCHNDTNMADANTIFAVKGGAAIVQATIGGIGERCGNCNLCTIIPSLQVKLGYPCIDDDALKGITKLSRQFSEIANIRISDNTAYVGKNAFMHKAGMHIDAVNKNPASFEHISPDRVGQSRQFVLSEVAGRVAVIDKAKTILPDIKKSSPLATQILERLKELENEGYVYEEANASFEMEVKKLAGLKRKWYEVKEFKVITDKPKKRGVGVSYAMVELEVDGETRITGGKGNGPVNAMD